MELALGDIATWVSSLIAVVSMVITVMAVRGANASARQQRRSDQIAWVDGRIDAMMEWANLVCSTISEAAHIIENNDLLQSRKVHLLSQLSALTDTGRWFFPNEFIEQSGNYKPIAYRGYRRPALDCILGAYRVLNGDDSPSNPRIALTEYQRAFVGHMHEAFTPHERETRMKVARDELAAAKIT